MGEEKNNHYEQFIVVSADSLKILEVKIFIFECLKIDKSMLTHLSEGLILPLLQSMAKLSIIMVKDLVLCNLICTLGNEATCYISVYGI